MSFQIEVSELPESISEFKPIPGHRALMGMEALAITSTEKQAETMAYTEPLKEGGKLTNIRSFTVDGTEIMVADTTIQKDVVGVDGVNTESVVPAQVAYYPSDLDSFGDGNVTYLWPRHKGIRAKGVLSALLPRNPHSSGPGERHEKLKHARMSSRLLAIGMKTISGFNDARAEPGSSRTIRYV